MKTVNGKELLKRLGIDNQKIITKSGSDFDLEQILDRILQVNELKNKQKSNKMKGKKEMKTLTDKFKEINDQIYDNYIKDLGGEYKDAVYIVDRVIKQLSFVYSGKDEFDCISRTIMRYLCENHHPHATLIITPTSAELLEGIRSTGEIMDYVKD